MKNAHDLTAQGTGASRTMPFKNFVLDPPSRNFFSPSSSPSPPSATSARPPSPSLARSLARQASDPKQCSHSSSTSTTTAPLFHRESTRSTRNYSIRGRDSSRFWGNVKIICRKEVVRKIRKGSRWIKFFFFQIFLYGDLIFWKIMSLFFILIYCISLMA